QKRLQRGVLETNLVGDLSVIQDVPLECRSKGEGYAAPLEDSLRLAVSDVAGGYTKSSGQAECRIEIRLGDADLRTLGHGRQFGGANIRPPPHEIGRNADRDGFWRDRDPAGTSQQRVHRLRRPGPRRSSRPRPSKLSMTRSRNSRRRVKRNAR